MFICMYVRTYGWMYLIKINKISLALLEWFLLLYTYVFLLRCNFELYSFNYFTCIFKPTDLFPSISHFCIYGT
jgi:hypothetical protein